MGVKGLQSFLKKNHRHFSTVKVLNNTTIIIDAMNLAWKLYEEMCLNPKSANYRNFIYGSDQASYSVLIREFFDALSQCSIKPIMVYDGAPVSDDTDDRESKEYTIYSRAIEKFKTAVNIREDQDSGGMLTSKSVLRTFKANCRDLEIECVANVFEADYHIARIANENNCCVLTNDSDFIVYILKQGFILLDYFDYKRFVLDDEGRKGILSHVFTQQNICKTLPGLKPENLALLSVLLGNDYVQSGTFSQIIYGICNKQYEGNLKVEPSREDKISNQSRIANLMTWLRNHSLDEAIQILTSQLDEPTGIQCRRKIKHLLESYRIDSADNFRQKFEAIYPNEDALDDNGEHLPSNYLMQLLKHDRLSSSAVDCIFHNTHYVYLGVEDWRLPSVNSVTYRALRVLVTLLRPKSYTNLSMDDRDKAAARDAMYICDREGNHEACRKSLSIGRTGNSDVNNSFQHLTQPKSYNNSTTLTSTNDASHICHSVVNHYRKLEINPLENLEIYGSLEHLNLYTFISLDRTSKKLLLMSTFRFNSDELRTMRDTLLNIFTRSFLDVTVICMMLVKYICLETCRPARPEFVDALILTMYYYADQKEGLNQDKRHRRILLDLKRHIVMKNHVRYNQIDSVYRRIVHHINQLSVAMDVYLRMNSFMNDILPGLRLDYFFNSTLIFRLTISLRFKQLVMEELCEDCDTLLDVCKSVKVQVLADE